jgi:hypothetical protein
VTTALSPAGESLETDPLDGVASGAESPVDGVESPRVSSGVGIALGRVRRAGDWTVVERVPASEASTSSLGLVTGAAARSTGPAMSRSVSRPSAASTYRRSSGAELGAEDLKPATPIVKSSNRCSNAENAPAHTMGRLGGGPAAMSTVMADVLGSCVSSSLGTAPALKVARLRPPLQPRAPVLEPRIFSSPPYRFGFQNKLPDVAPALRERRRG